MDKNSKQLLHLIPLEFRQNSETFELNQPNTEKALGLQWNTIDDCFSFKINLEILQQLRKEVCFALRVYIIHLAGYPLLLFLQNLSSNTFGYLALNGMIASLMIFKKGG